MGSLCLLLKCQKRKKEPKPVDGAVSADERGVNGMDQRGGGEGALTSMMAQRQRTLRASEFEVGF